MAEKEKKTNVDKLTEMLQFDPTSQSPTGKVWNKALEEVTKEVNERKQKVAEEQIKKAIELAQKMKQAKSAFIKEEAKFEKELGKALKKIKGLTGDNSPAEEEEEEEDKE